MNSVTAATASVDLSKTSFLIADDKAFFRDMIQTALTRAGAREIKHASTIETAVEALNRSAVGGVICDWDMAPVGGLELLRMIRCRSLSNVSPRTPVVILTSRADAAAVKSAMALDVNGFAVAPLSLEKLIKTIGNAFNRVWALQPASHYGAVPAVLPAHSGADANVSGKEIYKRADAEHRPAVAAAAQAATAKPLVRRAASEPKDELKNVHMCNLKQVQPGAILARDIHDRAGHLLIKMGTELKPSLLERLSGVAGGHDDAYHLWVGERVLG